MNTSDVLEFRYFPFKQIHIYHTNATINLARLQGSNGKEDKTELSGLRAERKKYRMPSLSSTGALIRLVG